MITFKIFKSVFDLPKQDWSQILNNKNIYLSLEYLAALEETLNDTISFHYILFYNRDKSPVGVAITQTLNFIDKGYTDNEEICKIRNKIKRRFVSGNGTKILTCGNPFASGENGFFFADHIPPKQYYKVLRKSIESINKLEKNSSVILFKEFWKDLSTDPDFLSKGNYTKFEIDVNMVMQVSEKWNSRNDYYDALNTKFRSKAKNAYHKSHDLLVKQLSVDDLESVKTELNDLYKAVVKKSSFDFGTLKAESFIKLKEKLMDQFVVKGYFYKNKLVGFSSAFLFDSILDANFVGIDYSLNHELAIYQRMLYDFVDDAILRKCKEIRFGRTAEEIKSSVGALPKRMILYIKHKSSFMNILLKSIISKTKPSSYDLRKPFKSDKGN